MHKLSLKKKKKTKKVADDSGKKKKKTKPSEKKSGTKKASRIKKKSSNRSVTDDESESHSKETPSKSHVKKSSERKASKVKTESIEDSRRRSSVIEEDSQSGDSSTYPLKADSMSDFEIEGPLGTGTFGKVLLTRWKPNLEGLYAIKTIQKTLCVQMKQVQHVKNEKTVMMAVNNPFICRCFAAFQDEENLYFVLEYVPGGEMFTILRKRRQFPEELARLYAAQLVIALSSLHKKRIVYRDIKPENILIDADGNIKLVDFGFAKHIEDKAWTICGTPEYMAPEIILSRGHDFGVDWWALGVLIYEMLAGFPPHQSLDHMRLYSAILKGDLRFPYSITPNARSLIRNLMNKDLTRRYGCMINGCADIKKHPWFSTLDWEKVESKGYDMPWKPALKDAADRSNFILEGQDFDSKFKKDIDVFNNNDDNLLYELSL
eukprot:CAMPEP_0168601248 /NCGR_PEP_ID=MMETSP0420-20121227/13316_1 /TAXON_ID=498008 /ORGANISM="Pessonella sp." /LENGTH=432 /DNA_ID=CAMNT_0008639593 /DNA_START=1 /DNA_END=1299 /DNA_ORIENTATION=-